MKVLFLAWGESIHARRRIQIFIDDPAFEVAVVSTWDYGFVGARSYLLGEAGPRLRAGRMGRAAIAALSDRVGGSALGLVRDAMVAARDLKILRRAVDEFRPDVVFMQTLLYPSYLGYALPRSIPTIVTFWNGDVLWWAKSNGIERHWKKQIVTHGTRRAAAITVNSQMAVEACAGYGADPARVHLIRYPGVELERFFPASKDEARRGLGIEARKVVFSPRGLGSYVNSDVIVNAIAEVARSHPDVCLVFASGAGGPEELERHRALARKLGIEARCRWQGQVPWESMPRYYNAADVMVSVSSNDSLPNSMLEAMACGVPVVMGDIPQIREWISDGDNGFLVPCRDASALAARLSTVLEGSALVERFKARNLELVRERADGRRNIQRLKELVLSVKKEEAP